MDFQLNLRIHLELDNNSIVTILINVADGYTVSDVVMYWKETPVRGVEDAELPQFTILGHETNDRKVRI